MVGSELERMGFHLWCSISCSASGLTMSRIFAAVVRPASTTAFLVHEGQRTLPDHRADLAKLCRSLDKLRRAVAPGNVKVMGGIATETTAAMIGLAS